jgi:hypothetical protein
MMDISQWLKSGGGKLFTNSGTKIYFSYATEAQRMD